MFAPFPSITEGRPMTERQLYDALEEYEAKFPEGMRNPICGLYAGIFPLLWGHPLAPVIAEALARRGKLPNIPKAEPSDTPPVANDLYLLVINALLVERMAIAAISNPWPDLATPESKWQVYFIQNTATGAIKIGVSRDPQRRVKDLATGSDARLELLFTTAGDESDERALHKAFQAGRTNGEWFNSTPRLEEFVALLRTGASISDALATLFDGEENGATPP